jgi:hypothetical protein
MCSFERFGIEAACFGVEKEAAGIGSTLVQKEKSKSFDQRALLIVQREYFRAKSMPFVTMS